MTYRYTPPETQHNGEYNYSAESRRSFLLKVACDNVVQAIPFQPNIIMAGDSRGATIAVQKVNAFPILSSLETRDTDNTQSQNSQSSGVTEAPQLSAEEALATVLELFPKDGKKVGTAPNNNEKYLGRPA